MRSLLFLKQRVQQTSDSKQLLFDNQHLVCQGKNVNNFYGNANRYHCGQEHIQPRHYDAYLDKN